MNAPQEKKSREEPADRKPDSESKDSDSAAPREIGGRAGPEPTRFGDWEKDGRCIDF